MEIMRSVARSARFLTRFVMSSLIWSAATCRRFGFVEEKAATSRRTPK